MLCGVVCVYKYCTSLCAWCMRIAYVYAYLCVLYIPHFVWLVFVAAADAAVVVTERAARAACSRRAFLLVVCVFFVFWVVVVVVGLHRTKPFTLRLCACACNHQHHTATPHNQPGSHTHTHTFTRHSRAARKTRAQAAHARRRRRRRERASTHTNKNSEKIIVINLRGPRTRELAAAQRMCCLCVNVCIIRGVRKASRARWWPRVCWRSFGQHTATHQPSS